MPQDMVLVGKMLVIFTSGEQIVNPSPKGKTTCSINQSINQSIVNLSTNHLRAGELVQNTIVLVKLLHRRYIYNYVTI